MYQINLLKWKIAIAAEIASVNGKLYCRIGGKETKANTEPCKVQPEFLDLHTKTFFFYLLCISHNWRIKCQDGMMLYPKKGSQQFAAVGLNLFMKTG